MGIFLPNKDWSDRQDKRIELGRIVLEYPLL